MMSETTDSTNTVDDGKWARLKFEDRARTFVTQLLRHLAGGSSQYELTQSLMEFQEATFEVGNWGKIGDILHELWVLEREEETAETWMTTNYHIQAMMVPALRLAAGQFSYNPIQTHKAKESLVNRVNLIGEVRAENRKRNLR